MSAVGVASTGLAAGMTRESSRAATRRPIAAVSINGRGPFRFVFDSAATRSAVSGQLLYALGLSAAKDVSVTVNGTLGRERRSAVHIDQLQCGVLLLHDQDLALLDRYAMPIDDGLLGIDGLMDKCVDIDVNQSTAHVIDSPVARAGLPSQVVPLLPHVSGLSMVTLDMAGIPCTAILDTGAERSVGNGAMRRVLHSSAGGQQAPLSDANGQSETGVLLSVPACRVGRAAMPAGPMSFSEANIFAMLGLVDRPALLLGMDRLSAFSRLVLDYRRASLLLKER